MISFEFTESPSESELSFLTKKINEDALCHGSVDPFAFFLRGQDLEILAGCNGYIIFQILYVDQLWVHPDQRKRGVGRALMEKAHEYGREKGCRLATVATMNFQAPKFYQALGYRIDLSRPSAKKGQSYLYLSKNLS